VRAVGLLEKVPPWGMQLVVAQACVWLKRIVGSGLTLWRFCGIGGYPRSFFAEVGALGYSKAVFALASPRATARQGIGVAGRAEAGVWGLGLCEVYGSARFSAP